MAGSVTQSPAETERLVREYLNLWNERRYEHIPRVVGESFVMYDPFAPRNAITGPKGEVHGRAGLEAFIRGTVKGFPDFQVDVLDLLCNDRLGMYEGRLTMTHEGDFFGFPPTGGHAEVRYMGSLRVAKGSVHEHRVYPPVREIINQLGFNVPGVVRLLPTLVVGKFRQLLGAYQH